MILRQCKESLVEAEECLWDGVLWALYRPRSRFIRAV